eukprot:jgi/Picsp_1/3586/NSC_06423-R1_---NA---
METLFPSVFESLLPTLAEAARQRGVEPGDVEEGRMGMKIWDIVSQRMSEKDAFAPLPPICLKPTTEIFSLAMDESSVCQAILGLADKNRPKSGTALLLDWSLSCVEESLRSKSILQCCQDIQEEYFFRMESLDVSCLETERNKDNWLEQLLAQVDEEERLTVDQMVDKNKATEEIDAPDDLGYDSAKDKKREMISMLSKAGSRKSDGCEHTMESSDLSLPRLEAGVHEKIFQPPNEIIQLLLIIRNDICASLSQHLPWQEASQFNGLVVGDAELIHAAEQAVLGNASPDKRISQDTFGHLRYMAEFAFNLVHRGLHQAFVHYNKGCVGQMSGDVISGMESLERMVEGLEVDDSPKHSLLKQALVTVSTTIPDARQLIIADQASFMNLYGVIQGCHLSVFQYSAYHGSRNVIESLEVDCFLASVAEMKCYLQTGAAALDMSPFAHVVVYESDTFVQKFLVDMIGSSSIPITLLRTSLEALLGEEVKMQAMVPKPEVYVENQHSTAVKEPRMQLHEVERNYFDTGREVPMAMGVPILGSLGLNPPYNQTFQMPPSINYLPGNAGIPLQQAWGGVAPHFVDNTPMHRHAIHLNQENDMSRSFESISQPFRIERGSYNTFFDRQNCMTGFQCDRATDGFGGELSQTADHGNQESLHKASLFDELPKKPFVLDERRFQSAYESIVDNPIQKLESLYESMRRPKRPRGRGEGFTSRCLQR